MAGKPFIQIPGLDALADRYRRGESVYQICHGTDLSAWTLRRRFSKMGILRGRGDAVRTAFETGRMAGRKTRKGVPNSEQARQRISQGRIRWSDAHAKGVRVNSNGYLEYTRKNDPNFGRHVHVVNMEQRIGRKLLADECVHHIDGNKLNNDIHNLALMTRSAHSSLHRFEERLAQTTRPRAPDGTFKKGDI